MPDVIKTTVTAKGQVVISATLRRKYGIKAGTRVIVLHENGQIVLKPMTSEYYRSLRGVLKGKRVLKALMDEGRQSHTGAMP